MNAGDYVATAAAAFVGGGFIAGALIVRKSASELDSVIRDGSWRGYTFTASAAMRPPAHPKAALNGSAPARAPESHAERPAIAPVPQGDLILRADAAETLGVSERSLRRHAREWGIEEIPVPGRRTLVTAESVNRYLSNGRAT